MSLLFDVLGDVRESTFHIPPDPNVPSGDHYVSPREHVLTASKAGSVQHGKCLCKLCGWHGTRDVRLPTVEVGGDTDRLSTALDLTLLNASTRFIINLSSLKYVVFHMGSIII